MAAGHSRRRCGRCSMMAAAKPHPTSVSHPSFTPLLLTSIHTSIDTSIHTWQAALLAKMQQEAAGAQRAAVETTGSAVLLKAPLCPHLCPHLS